MELTEGKMCTYVLFGSDDYSVVFANFKTFEEARELMMEYYSETVEMYFNSDEELIEERMNSNEVIVEEDRVYVETDEAPLRLSIETIRFDIREKPVELIF